MDVQSDATDPASGESQPGGKKKGFKLFGKRKPGSIFSLRKAEEKDHAVERSSKTPDGSPESCVSSPEHEEESVSEEQCGPNGRADAALQDEEAAMMAAGAHRSSICSTGSIRSLSFLLRLRGGKKGGRGDCMAQTVSQPAPGRQRRGIKGLFSNVKFPQNKSHQQEDKAEVPSSPLLMSSRSNSVEIIKEDMTLTPRPLLRKNHSASEGEGAGPASPVDPVSPAARSPQEPGDAGLSFLLADISSLLTFDSITAGGDIMADVAAEWDKASAAISARDTAELPATPSPKPVRFSPPTYAPTVTPAAPRSSTAQKPAAAASLFTQPRAAEFKSPSLSSHPFQPPSAAVSSPATASLSTFMTVRSSAPRSAPSSSLVTLTSFSTPQVMTSTLINTAPPLKPTRVADPTPVKPPPPPVRAPYGGLVTLSSMPVKPASEAGVPAVPLAREPFRAAPTPPTVAPVTYSLPANLPFTPYDKPDSRSAPSSQSSSDKPPTDPAPAFPTGESRASGLLVQAKPPSHTPAVISEMPPLPVTSLVSTVNQDKTLYAPSLIASDPNTQSFQRPQVASAAFSSTPAPVSSNKPASVPAPVPPAARPAAAPQCLDKTPSAPLPSSQTAAPASTPLPSTTHPSAPAFTGPTPASKTPPLPIPPPFCRPTPVNPALSSSIPPTTAPTPCPSASRAPTHATVIPGPVAPSPSTPDPHQADPAPAALTTSCITPAPALTTSAPASRPPVPAPVISSPVAPPAPSAPDTVAAKPGPGQAPGPGRAQPSADPGPAASLSGANDKGGVKPVEPQHASLPVAVVKDRRAPPGKLAGLSKIPVAGGGRAGKPPARDAHPPLHGGDGDRSPDPFTPGPTPASTPAATPASTPAATPAATPEDERPRLSPQDGRGRAGAGVVPATRQPPHQDESQLAQRPQPPRDSKIPVKHGPPPASQPREPPRSKIPTSKVPVRRLGSNKPAATSSTALQMRK